MTFVDNFIFFFLKLIISSACSLKDAQNLFMQSLHLYTSCIFSMLLNDDIVDIENFYETCSPVFLKLFPIIFFGWVIIPSQLCLSIKV